MSHNLHLHTFHMSAALVAELRELHERALIQALKHQLAIGTSGTATATATGNLWLAGGSNAMDDTSSSSSSSSSSSAQEEHCQQSMLLALRYPMGDQALHAEVWSWVKTAALAKLSPAEQLMVRCLATSHLYHCQCACEWSTSRRILLLNLLNSSIYSSLLLFTSPSPFVLPS
jgi:hypothetical protein